MVSFSRSVRPKRILEPLSQRIKMSRLEEMSPLEIGERLKTARNSAGKTQDDAANAIGGSRQTLISLAKGGRKVKPEELEQLAHFFGRPLNLAFLQDCVPIPFYSPILHPT